MERAGQVQHHPSHRPHDPAADLQQFEADRPDLGRGQFRSRQPLPSQRLQEHVRRRRQEHPELVREERMATRPIRKEAQRLFFDPVLRLAPRRTPRTPRKLSLPLVHKMGEGHSSWQCPSNSTNATTPAGRPVPVWGQHRKPAKIEDPQDSPALRPLARSTSSRPAQTIAAIAASRPGPTARSRLQRRARSGVPRTRPSPEYRAA